MLKTKRISRDEALAAHPMRAAQASLTDAKLTMPIKTPRAFRWLFRFPSNATRSFELDETGLLVWQMCDGKNDVRKIARFVAMRTGAKSDEAEIATLKFLQILEARGLISVKTDD